MLTKWRVSNVVLLALAVAAATASASGAVAIRADETNVAVRVSGSQCATVGATRSVTATGLLPATPYTGVYATTTRSFEAKKKFTTDATGALSFDIKMGLWGDTYDVDHQSELYLPEWSGRSTLVLQEARAGVYSGKESVDGFYSSGIWVARRYAVATKSRFDASHAYIRAWGLKAGHKYFAHLINGNGRYSGKTLQLKPGPLSFGPCSLSTPAFKVWGTWVHWEHCRCAASGPRAQIDTSRGYRRKTKSKLMATHGALLESGWCSVCVSGRRTVLHKVVSQREQPMRTFSLAGTS